MIPLNEAIGITSIQDNTVSNTSNGSPNSLSFSKVLLHTCIFICTVLLLR